MGLITPVGTGVEAFWASLREGRSGVRAITRFDASPFPTRIAAQVDDFDPLRYMDRRDARRMDRFVQMALAAARMALEDANLRLEDCDRDQVGITMGTGIGGIHTLVEQMGVMAEKGPDRVSPFFIPMMIANMAGGQLAIALAARGPNTTHVTACAASANAIGDAFRILQRGEAQVMLTGGSEGCLVPIALAGFCAMKALSERNDEPARASRPFDAQRDGFVMGEGAGVLVLEALPFALARGARILAEVVGYGMTGDAYHITAPPPDGNGGARAMRRALADAGLEPTDVDYINAHGTATPQGDAAETAAIRAVFGEHAYRIPVSSTKSMTGHLLGAAGVVELAACILAIRDGVVPPTINYEYPDPECDLDYVPNRARPHPVRVALSNSFGFGGQNATLIVKRYEG
ncbi:MAG: beta-ketoacyl-ACP synthase II [Firmicutes bacterium]|nr:beta-ketoacyl-ACP synthase II [Bacillota bacterium]